MNSFKRLSPYIGPNIPEQIRQYQKALMPFDREFGEWEWADREDGTGTYHWTLLLWDMDSDTIDPAGYVSIVPLEDGTCFVNDCLGKKFEANAKILSSKIFETIPQAKAFLDSVLAFDTPEIPVANL
jgi:hypothetical protein